MPVHDRLPGAGVKAAGVKAAGAKAEGAKSAAEVVSAAEGVPAGSSFMEDAPVGCSSEGGSLAGDAAARSSAGNAPVPVLLLDLGRELRGGQRQTLYLAEALSRDARFSPLLICPGASALAEAAATAGVSCLPLPGHGLGNLRLLWHFWRGVRRALATPAARCILHTQDARAASLGALAKRVLGARLLLVHSRRVSYPFRQGVRFAKYRAADALVAVSRDIAAQAVAAGLAPERVVAVHSGIDPTRYTPRAGQRTPAAATAAAPWMFLGIGALTPQKGYDIVLRAMQRLSTEPDLPPWKVRIVGEGALRPALETLARELGVDARLEMPGWIESPRVLPDGDAVVVASVDGEGSSGAIKEGWVSGLPVLASALPGNAELIVDGDNGLLSDAGNAEALAASMARCLREPDLSARLVAGGWRSLPSVTVEHMTGSTIAVYVRLLAGLSARAPSPATTSTGDHEPDDVADSAADQTHAAPSGAGER